MHLRTAQVWYENTDLSSSIQRLNKAGFKLVHKTQNPFSVTQDIAGETMPCCYKLIYARL